MRGAFRLGWSTVIAFVFTGSHFAGAAQAQSTPPAMLPDHLIRSGEKETPGSSAIVDHDVEPAGLLQPGAPEKRPNANPRAVADPPAPLVRIQVRVPADSPPGDDLKYLITIQNTSNADAHSVTVRNPLPAGAKAVKADPAWHEKETNEKQLVWKFGTLAPGKSKTIELTLRPEANAAEIRNLAYVSYEYGEAVTTRINKPAVKVTKLAPKQSVRDEPFTVRIAVDNTGKVPADNVRVVENLPLATEVEPLTKGAKRTDRRDAAGGADGQQWVWEIPRLMPGERKLFEYRITPRAGKEIYSLTSIASPKKVEDRAEARTKVLVPGLAVKLAGPTASAPVNPGEPAKYEITVRNTGTMPSTNVRVTGTIPADCRPTKKTAGGVLSRDSIQWVIPRLGAGEAQTFRFEVKSASTGRRVVVAAAADSRGQRAADEMATLFQGVAALVWESIPNPVALSVGKQGTFTVRVRNNGGEAARNVRVEINIPDAVTAVQVTPRITLNGSKLVFGPETIAPGGEAVYTLTYEAKQSAQAWFKLKLTADCLGDRPMETEKVVEITGGG
ncbi:MAG TPA: hypothetical protein VLM40_07355 [Gemmata sp.]|nr:hypothetical protein [Gemmata sp.]